MIETNTDSTRRINVDVQLKIAPFNFIRSGYYHYSSGGIAARSGNGYYWQSKVHSTTYARNLDFTSTSLRPQGYNAEGYGFTVRCLVR